MYRASFVEQVQGHQCISTRPLPPLSKNFRNLPLVGHANRPHMRRGHGGAYLSYEKVRQTYRGAPCRISGSGDRRKGARGRIPRGHSCAFCVSSLYLTSPKTIEMTDWAPVWEMYMEFSIYRLDYISSVYTHARWTSKRGPRRSRYNSTVWGPRLLTCANPNVQPKPGMVRYRPVFQKYGVHVAVRVRAICQNGL